jgi:hypothetical protein
MTKKDHKKLKKITDPDGDSSADTENPRRRHSGDQKEEIDPEERGDEISDEDENENDDDDELTALPSRNFSKRPPASTIHRTDQSAVSTMGNTAKKDDEDLWCCCRIIPDSVVRFVVYVLQLDILEARREQRAAQRRAEQRRNATAQTT